MISSNPVNEERGFLICFFVVMKLLKYLKGKNSGRESDKFLERQRIKNPYTHKYYNEKDFTIGNLIYINTYIFKLIQNYEYAKKYMENNSDNFMDSDIRNVVSKIKIKSKSFGEYQDFLIYLLYVIDSRRNNYASKDDIINGFKTFKVYLFEQELLIFIWIKIIYINNIIMNLIGLSFLLLFLSIIFLFLSSFCILLIILKYSSSSSSILLLLEPEK